MRELLEDATRRAVRYLEGLPERRVASLVDAARVASELGGDLPDEGLGGREVLRALDEAGAPATVACAGPRYFGFVTGGVLPAALAANWLAGAWDQNAFSRVSSPLGAAIEDTALGWLVPLLGLPSGTAGAFVTGATMANFTALLAARRSVLASAGWDAERLGLFGAPTINVVVGEQAHATLYKALGMLGLGRERITTVPADEEGRMRADALGPVPPPAIVCLQAGNVNTGAFDPAASICPRVRGTGTWVHVDGAFGLWAAAAPERAHLVAGFDGADSWAVDAHKWLNVPYDCGVAFVRDGEALRGALGIDASYLPDDPGRDPFDYTPESSRRARGIEVWAALRCLGRSGLAELIERNCRFAQRFEEGLASAGFEILNHVVLNQVLVSFGNDARTRRVVAAVQEEGTCWCGGTLWQGRAAMRISVCSWATRPDDVERSLEAIVRVATTTL